MAHVKVLLRRLFCLPPPLLLPLVLLAAVLLILSFSLGWQGAAAGLAYFLSAYALAALVASAKGAYRAVRAACEHSNLYARAAQARFFHDVRYRTSLLLLLSLLINLLYIAFKLSLGLYYRSAWLLVLAAYYLVLALIRALLLRHVRRDGMALREELRRYRLCGISLLVLAQALVGVAVLIVCERQSGTYPGVTIYALAAYTFYALILAIVGLVRYRRRNSPVLSSVKAVNLTAALVSLLSLETALLNRFGEGEERFRRLMTACSCGAVYLFVLAMAAYMIARATRLLRENTAGKAAKKEV